MEILAPTLRYRSELTPRGATPLRYEGESVRMLVKASEALSAGAIVFILDFVTLADGTSSFLVGPFSATETVMPLGVTVDSAAMDDEVSIVIYGICSANTSILGANAPAYITDSGGLSYDPLSGTNPIEAGTVLVDDVYPNGKLFFRPQRWFDTSGGGGGITIDQARQQAVAMALIFG